MVLKASPGSTVRLRLLRLPEVSNRARSAEVAEDKAAYGTLLYSNLIVIISSTLSSPLLRFFY